MRSQLSDGEAELFAYEFDRWMADMGQSLVQNPHVLYAAKIGYVAGRIQAREGRAYELN